MKGVEKRDGTNVVQQTTWDGPSPSPIDAERVTLFVILNSLACIFLY